MTISIVFILSHAKVYVKKERDHLRVIYDTLTILKNEKKSQYRHLKVTRSVHQRQKRAQKTQESEKEA